MVNLTSLTRAGKTHAVNAVNFQPFSRKAQDFFKNFPLLNRAIDPVLAEDLVFGKEFMAPSAHAMIQNTIGGFHKKGMRPVFPALMNYSPNDLSGKILAPTRPPLISTKPSITSSVDVNMSGSIKTHYNTKSILNRIQ